MYSFSTPSIDWCATLFYVGQQWLDVFTFDLARYLIGAGLVSAVLFVILRNFSERHRIQARRASRKDICREVSYSVMTVCVYASVGVITVEIIERGWSRMYFDFDTVGVALGVTWSIISIGVLLVLHDCYFYWVHRLMHHPLLYRKVHRTHHLSVTPTSWAAYSFSPYEATLMTLFVPMAIQIIPVHPAALSIFLAIMILRNALGHSGIEVHPSSWVDSPLDFLTTVTHHDLHHQKFNGNYGLYFTWWDRWMGTELPEYKTAFKKVAPNKNKITTPHHSAIDN